jgi:hypothetical protein
MSQLQASFPSTTVHRHTVDEDAVAAFALAINDRNPRYQLGEAVPPLFTVLLALPTMWESQRLGPGPEVITGSTGGVHGQQDVYYYGPVKPDMSLLCRGSTFCVMQTKGGVLVVERMVVTDQHGQRLVEHFWSNFYIGGTTAENIGPLPPDHTFPDDARHRPIGKKLVAIDRDQTFRYGGVSGDRTGHATNNHVARTEGYPGKILQGMCTFGLASGALVDLLADGDPNRLRRLAVRFAQPAVPAKNMIVDVYDAGASTRGGKAFAFEAVQEGVVVLKHGRVELD